MNKNEPEQLSLFDYAKLNDDGLNREYFSMEELESLYNSLSRIHSTNIYSFQYSLLSPQYAYEFMYQIRLAYVKKKGVKQ